MIMSYVRRLLVLTLLLTPISGPVLAQEKQPCERFEWCIHGILNAQEPLERVILASEALKLWNQSIPKRDLLNVLTLRGEALLALHETGQAAHLNLLEHAEADYRRFMEQDPKHWLPHAQLGRIAELRQDPAQARQHYDKAVQTGQTLAFYERAAYHVRQQALEAALADLGKALEQNRKEEALKRGLHPAQLAPVHQLRYEINMKLQRAMAAEIDRKAACQLGVKALCN